MPPLSSLRIDVGAAVETAPGAPASAAASVEGSVQLAPEVAFSYDGSGSGTASASPSGSWAALYGGKDLTGTLNPQLSIFGTPIFQSRTGRTGRTEPKRLHPPHPPHPPDPPTAEVRPPAARAAQVML